MSRASAIMRALRVEAVRLPRDAVLLGCAAAALLPGIAVLAALLGEPAGTMPGSALGSHIAINAVMVAASFGALRASTRFAAGVQAGDVLRAGFGAATLARGAAAVAGGAVLACFVALVVTGAGSANGSAPDASVWASALIAGSAGALWGDAVGSIVRSPLAVLLVVAATLTPAALLANDLPDLAANLPLGAALTAVGQPLTADTGLGWPLAVAWLTTAVVTATVSSNFRGSL